MTTMMPPTSFLVVGNLLEDTITRTAKTQNGADGELTWLRKRLENERRDPRARGKLALESDRSSSSSSSGGSQPRANATTKNVLPADKENASAGRTGGPRADKVSPTGMSVLQLRRFLRAVGQPTVGLKPALAARLEDAVSSGAVKAFVDSARAQPRAEVECAGERRKTETMLAMAESMLNLDSGAAEAAAAPAASVDTTAPKLPLRESLSSTNNDRSSRSSAGSGAGKAQVLQQAPAPATPAPATSKLLSGQEQDAVVAKIRSAAKRSASPEKKLPYQDDDTPNTKGARLKKEMEDRFARNKAVKKLQQQPAPAMPSAEAEALPTPVTPPSARPPVPSSPAPMPPASPPCAGSPPPPPPTADAPRPADLAKSENTAASAHKTGGDNAAVPASPKGAAPVPADSTKKGVTTAAAVDAVADGVSALSVTGDGQAAAESGAGGPTVDKPAATASKFGSPGRHRVPPSSKTPTRKANPFAKDSISSPGPSGLKAAAHKAFHRVGVKPAPSTPDIPSPTGSTTQDAFAKFRAMDSNSKKGGASVPSFKARPCPSPKGPSSSAKQASSAAGGTSTSGQMLPPQKLDFGASKTSSSTTTPSYSSKRAGDAAATGGDAEPSAVKARADAAAKAADEARRDAQARAEQKTREAAMKAAAEREEKVRKEEEKKKKDAERKRQLERRAAERLAERAAAAEALRKAEDKKKAEKRAAAEEKAAAAAAAAREKAEAAARKEEEEADAAADLKRVADAEAAAAAAAAAAVKPVKPPTPPRTASKPPPTPPRPGHKGQAQAPPPPTPPRPAAATAAASAPQAPPASPWTHSKPVGTSASGGAGEARAVALAKKKEEIAKRMEEIRNKKTKGGAAPAPAAPAPVAKAPAAAPKPPPVPTPAPAPAPAPVKSAPPAAETKEERESYDAYDVEPESGSESGEEEEEAAPEIQEPKEASDKSAIPDWARGKALAKILDKQYGGPNPLNPDKIFPEFFTCNLEHIFNTKKQKWDRSSSGNWHTDRLTIAEKLAYQRAMGFDK